MTKINLKSKLKEIKKLEQQLFNAKLTVEDYNASLLLPFIQKHARFYLEANYHAFYYDRLNFFFPHTNDYVRFKSLGSTPVFIELKGMRIKEIESKQFIIVFKFNQNVNGLSSLDWIRSNSILFIDICQKYRFNNIDCGEFETSLFKRQNELKEEVTIFEDNRALLENLK